MVAPEPAAWTSALFPTCTHRLILRIAISDPTASHDLSDKFGADPADLAPALLEEAARMGVNVCGIR